LSSFRLGLLVIICGSILLITIIWLGASHYFEENLSYVTYFDESVKGLQQDAIVNYRGVGVGRAVDIGLAPDGRLIKVVMHLRPDFRVDRTLAIQLREMGLTGLRYLEIDTAPANIQELTPEIDFPSEHPVIPSYPSEIVQLKAALETIYRKVNEIDLQRLAEDWTKTGGLINEVLAHMKEAIDPGEWRGMVKAINQAALETARFTENINKATAPGMKKGVDDLAGTLEAARSVSEKLARQLHALPPDTLHDIAGNLKETIASGNRLVAHVDRQFAQSNALLRQSILQLGQLLAQLSALAQEIKDQPSRVVFPPRVKDPFERK
jgi:phospholipid/cholesterol/gamma-HCH transport system substrate-binding protein